MQGSKTNMVLHRVRRSRSGGGGLLPYTVSMDVRLLWVCFEKVCTYDWCLFKHPSTYYGYLLRLMNLTEDQNDLFLTIVGGFSTNLAPIMGALL